MRYIFGTGTRTAPDGERFVQVSASPVNGRLITDTPEQAAGKPKGYSMEWPVKDMPSAILGWGTKPAALDDFTEYDVPRDVAVAMYEAACRFLGIAPRSH